MYKLQLNQQEGEKVESHEYKEGTAEVQVEWKEPPRPPRYKAPRQRWLDIADRLRANPEEWALIAKDVNPSTVTHIRQGRIKAFEPAGAYEASGHGRTDRGGTAELYARYIGDAPVEADEMSFVDFDAFSDPDM
jgi:hypothetical protein